MRAWWGLFVLAGCGGGGDGAGDDDDDATTAPLECNLPNYDLPSLTCDGLAAAWRDTVEAGNGCNVAADCVALRAPCETWWQVDCWYTARGACVDAAKLQTFAAESGGCNTGGDSCICGAEPILDCVDHECVAVGE